MKIDALTSSQESMAAKARDISNRVGRTGAEFSSELSDQEDSMSREELKRLLDKIDEQGAKLTNTPTFDELKEYRNLVKTFVSEAVSRMYSIHSQSGWDRMGRQKVYTTVRKIDKELEDMAEKIRLGQADSLSIIAGQDAIRGMLVDLYS